MPPRGDYKVTYVGPDISVSIVTTLRCESDEFPFVRIKAPYDITEGDKVRIIDDGSFIINLRTKKRGIIMR